MYSYSSYNGKSLYNFQFFFLFLNKFSIKLFFISFNNLFLITINSMENLFIVLQKYILNGKTTITFSPKPTKIFIPYFNYLDLLIVNSTVLFFPIIASVHTLYYIPWKEKGFGFVYSNVPISLYLINLENYSWKPL